MSLKRIHKVGALIIVALMAVSGFIGVTNALNPLSNKDWEYDPDNDGLNNLEEFTSGSDPNNWDTDGDGLPDGWEVDNSLDPTDPADAELDNDYWGGEEYASYSAVPESHYNNYDEYFRYLGDDPETGKKVYRPTDPNNPDTDGDSILDPDDAWPWDFSDKGGAGAGGGSDTMGPGEPLEMETLDTDGDGILDLDETLLGTDAFNPDTDGDGLSDSQELALDLDPNDWDTDDDMLIDGVEMGSGDSTDGHLKDSDNDGLPDYWEDNDNDGILNGEEQDVVMFWLLFWMSRQDGGGGLDPEYTYRIKYRGASLLGMDPNTNDTDSDEISDDKELQAYGPGPINKNSRSEYGYHQVNNKSAKNTNENSPYYNQVVWKPDRYNDDHSISNPNSGFSIWTENRYSWYEYWMTKAYNYGELPVNKYNVVLYNVNPWLWWYMLYDFALGNGWVTAEQFAAEFLHLNLDVSALGIGPYKQPVTFDDIFGWMEHGPATTDPKTFRWNMYDINPCNDDTDNDRMEDNWDPRPTIPDDRLDTAIALRRIGFPTPTGSLDWYWPEFGPGTQYPVSAILAPTFVWYDGDGNFMHDYFGFPYRIIDSTMNKGDPLYMEIMVGIERGEPGSEFFQRGFYQYLNVSIGFHNGSIDVPEDEWGDGGSVNESYDFDDDIDGDGIPMGADNNPTTPWAYNPSNTDYPMFSLGLDDLNPDAIPDYMHFEEFDPTDYSILTPFGTIGSDIFPGPDDPYVDPTTGLGHGGQELPFVNVSQYPNPDAPLRLGTNWLVWSSMTFYTVGFYFMVPEGVMAGYVVMDYYVNTDQNIHVEMSFDVFSGLGFGVGPDDGWPYMAY